MAKFCGGIKLNPDAFEIRNGIITLVGAHSDDPLTETTTPCGQLWDSIFFETVKHNGKWLLTSAGVDTDIPLANIVRSNCGIDFDGRFFNLVNIESMISSLLSDMYQYATGSMNAGDFNNSITVERFAEDQLNLRRTKTAYYTTAVLLNAGKTRLRNLANEAYADGKFDAESGKLTLTWYQIQYMLINNKYVGSDTAKAENYGWGPFDGVTGWQEYAEYNVLNFIDRHILEVLVSPPEANYTIKVVLTTEPDTPIEPFNGLHNVFPMDEPDGQYTITVTAEGYDDFSDDVTADSDQILQAELTPSAG